MRKIIFISMIICFYTATMFGQNYMTRTGTIKFFSEAPLENIEAVNNQVSSAFNKENGEFAFSLLMKAFNFEKALMQEHFNEKYVHSEKYPKSTFKGVIVDYDAAKISSNPTEFTVKGSLTIHGVTKEIEEKISLVEKGDGLQLKSNFQVKLADFNIEIPSAVKDNISKTIDITVDTDYDKM